MTEQNIKKKIEIAGTKLTDWNVVINYGIKTGLNEAFIIDNETKNLLIENDPKSAEIIRPILRGQDIEKNEINFSQKYLIALFPSKKYSIDDFPAIKNWLQNGDWVLLKTKKNPPTPLGSGILRLQQTGQKQTFKGISFTSRKKTSNKWFELQDSIAYSEDFFKQKIVFSRISGTNPKFALDNNQFMLNDTGYLITGNDLTYLFQQLTSNEIWFAFQRFYMGGGIEKEFKVNNLLKLPIPKKGVQLNLSQSELKFIHDFYKRNQLP